MPHFLMRGHERKVHTNVNNNVNVIPVYNNEFLCDYERLNEDFSTAGSDNDVV